MALASSVDTLSGGGGPAIQAESKLISVYGTFVPSGSYVSGGDTWDLTAMTLPAGWILPGFGVPMYVWIWEQTAGGNSGYSYCWVPGNALNNQKVQVFQNAGAGNPASELSAAGYPAAVKAATIKFCAVFSFPA